MGEVTEFTRGKVSTMAFRRGKSEALEWKHWLDRNRPALVECGLPAEVYADRRSRLYFLEHASLSDRCHHDWFSLEMLSREQMERLYAFLTADRPPWVYDPCIVRVLRGELGIPQPDLR